MILDNLGRFSGKKKKIAIIDSGVGHHIASSNYHQVNFCGTNEQKKFTKQHGFLVYKIISLIAPESEVYDLNILDVDEKINLEYVNLAIKHAIDLSVDIINISIGMIEPNDTLAMLCEEAKAKGILVFAASHPYKAMYPESLDSVYSVDYSYQDIQIKKYDMKIYLGLNFFSKTINEVFKKRNSSLGMKGDIQTSSYGCAFFSGLVLLLLEKYPLDDPFKLLSDNVETFEMPAHIIESSSATRPKLNLDDYDIVVHHSYLDSYLSQNKKIHVLSLKNEENKPIIEINPTKLPVSTAFPDEKTLKIGEYFDKSLNHTYRGSKYLIAHDINAAKRNYDDLPVPIVHIVSYGYESSKFEVLCYINHTLMNKKIRGLIASYNPLSLVYGYNALFYPEQVVYPNIVYSIKDIYNQLVLEQNPDIIVTSIPDSFWPLNFNNDNRFGALCRAYDIALPPDITIFIISGDIEYNRINSRLVELTDGRKLIIVISDYRILNSSLQNEQGYKPVKCDEARIEKTYHSFSQVYPVFTMAQVRTGMLGEYLLELLKEE